jgi:hypothetical protein
MDKKHSSVEITRMVLTFIWILGWLFTTGVVLANVYQDSEITFGLIVKNLIMWSVGWPLAWGTTIHF